MLEGPETEEGVVAVVEGKNVDTRGSSIERIAEEVPTEGRETTAAEDIGGEGSSKMREEMEEDRSTREEKIDEEARGIVEEGEEDTVSLGMFRLL
ncbi:hypothetical protein KI387_007235, partial [Taxus chinensis]